MTQFCQLCQRERDKVFMSGGVQACHLHFSEAEWDDMLGDEESQRYQDEGEAAAHLHGAWA